MIYLHEGCETHLRAPHRRNGVEPFGGQPSEATPSQAVAVLVHQNVVGDAVLRGKLGAVEFLNLGQRLFEEGVVLLPSGGTHLGKVAGMTVQPSAFDEPKLGERFGAAQQKMQRLAVRQLVDGEGVAKANFVACKKG